MGKYIKFQLDLNELLEDISSRPDDEIVIIYEQLEILLMQKNLIPGQHN